MIGRLPAWLRRILRRGPVKNAIDAEIEFHVEMQTRRYVKDGLDPALARDRARRRLGDADRVRRECRTIVETGAPPVTHDDWFRGIRQDITYAWRVLRRAPLFTATALVTIALGIGATTAIFSVVNDVLLRRLPYPSADRLVLMWNSYKKTEFNYTAVSPPEFADLHATRNAFDMVSAISPQPSTLLGGCIAGDCEPERVNAYVVSPNIFDLLMVTPQIGRLFTEADGAETAEKVAILSDALWRRRFGADRNVIGRTINVTGRERLVVGVMPPGVRFPDAPLLFLKDAADLWLPYSWEQRRTESRGNQYIGVIARLAPGLPFSRAQRDLDALADRFRADFPERYARPGSAWSIAAVSLRDQMIGDVRPELFVLLGVVGVVLLIACANVANLLLARGSARAAEFAVRNALGASRVRLIRQLLIEAGVLTLAGGTLGVIVAAWGMPALIHLDPSSIPRLEGARLDGTVLGFALGVTVITGLLLGLVPAIRQSGTMTPSSLGDGARGGVAAPLRRGVRAALVITEVALAIIVLAGAGLLVRTFTRLMQVPRGFDASQVVTLQVTPARTQYDTPAKLLAFHQDVVARLAALPGVTEASAVYPLPMGGDHWSGSFFVENLPVEPDRAEQHAEYHVALPGYFHSVRIPVLAGREFTADDSPAALPTVIVDEVLAKQYWPTESAIGKRIGSSGSHGPWLTVVGVVGHVRVAGPRTEGEPQLYLPLTQSVQAPLYFTARTSGDPSSFIPAVRDAVRQADSRLAIGKLGPMSDLVSRVLARERFSTLLFTIFGAIALVLAAVGLYGVMAFLVEQRTREIGIRLALGGQPAHVLRGILGEGLTLAAAGVAVGLAIALPLSRLLKDSLFGVTPTDPATYAGIAGLLLAVAVIATYVPARRAMKVDPVEVLRK